ncbi:MAG: YmdB family metallophosphoesterase, partial [Oscillospiraceae bacterium]|nr:YmdB family metallophosphoesterase [Oscillospiraceae bacterium]
MKALFIGDAVGVAGCEFLRQRLIGLKMQYEADLVIVNGENSAQGNGITPASAKMILSSGADVITTGNHAFKQRESVQVFNMRNVLRPANFSDEVIGKGLYYHDSGYARTAVINIMGTVFMDSLDNPFVCIDRILEIADTPNIIVDFHAEATSEKKAF